MKWKRIKKKTRLIKMELRWNLYEDMSVRISLNIKHIKIDEARKTFVLKT